MQKRGPIVLVLIGPPGCGKGTQAERVCDAYHFEYISTGNLIREEVSHKTALGKRVQAILDEGHFVDDPTIIELVSEHIKKIPDALLFDGFPRTLTQAHALDMLTPVTVAIHIEVNDEEVVKRISSRWMVELNNQQHTFLNKTMAEEYVKKNGGQLFQRHDDKPEVVTERLEVYHNLTEPIIEYYGGLHKLYTINGEKSPDAVYRDIQKIVEKVINAKKRKRLTHK
jgi:adenylate kinase